MSMTTTSLQFANVPIALAVAVAVALALACVRVGLLSSWPYCAFVAHNLFLFFFCFFSRPPARPHLMTPPSLQGISFESSS